FTWTPGIADAGGEDLRIYQLTFEVVDEHGALDAVTIKVTVVNDGGVIQSTQLRFVEPSGAGMAVDLAESPCVEFNVKIKADQVPEDEVLLDILPPTPEGATLTPADRPAKEKRFSWCPTPAQLDASLSHLVELAARRLGGDERVIKRFQVRFKREAAVGCPGQPPEIIHTPPTRFEGALNYEITATIRDDVGFKSPPALLYVIDPPQDPRDAAPAFGDWSLVEFYSQGGDVYTASIPNPGLNSGAEASIFYVIIATDNDDPNATRCDHSVESEIFAVEARGGGESETYGYCHGCVSDDQCGGPDDLCVDLGGAAFCVAACGAQGCGEGRQCVQIHSVEGRALSQCLPVDMNCGQRCLDDPFDQGARNDDEAHATLIEPGDYAGMTICGEDQDFYRFDIAAGQQVSARITFENLKGDLDMAMALPGARTPEGLPAYNYQSLSGDQDIEQVREHCAQESGEVLLWVGPYNHSHNDYDLLIEVGPGECDRFCEDDLFDYEAPNNTPETATSAEPLPFFVEDLVLCPGDVDYFSFHAQAGQLISVGASFTHSEGNLDLALYDEMGGLITGAFGFFDGEILEVEATADGLYTVAVYGATPSASAPYTLWIEAGIPNACEHTLSCPAGTFCDGQSCVEAACTSGVECGAGHLCAAYRVGADPAASGGECVANCAHDLECRVEAEYRCKRFEDFTQACAQAGLGGVGARCTSYQDCDGA
ncbi:PPC domain-containing protein, partial [Myxococcota bacterium]|nr:PPC domain-containing protein [Myxococcota bacterium]